MTDSAFLQSLSPQERVYFSSMPADLQEIVNNAARITTASQDTITKSIGLIDHTSLKEGKAPMVGIETPEEINKLCKAAKSQNGYHAAAVCVYPNQIEVAKQALTGSDVKLAVVNNFPHGDLSAEDAAADAAQSVAAGTHEVDTVMDYAEFINLNDGSAREKLAAVATAVHAGGAKLKIILKASTYALYKDLYEAAATAIECGADFVKTCTGKMPLKGYGLDKPDASTLLTAVTVMKAVADRKTDYPDVGVKISGGVKTPVECEQMRSLVEHILGDDYYQPNRFRFGASSLLGNLKPEAAPVPLESSPGPTSSY